MEDVLELYEVPHDPNNPVVCFDELPYQMLAETRTPISAKPGRSLRCDYEYEHKGTCNLCVNPIVQTAHIINFRPSGYVTLRIRGEGPRRPTGGPGPARGLRALGGGADARVERTIPMLF